MARFMAMAWAAGSQSQLGDRCRKKSGNDSAHLNCPLPGPASPACRISGALLATFTCHLPGAALPACTTLNPACTTLNPKPCLHNPKNP
eukprot:352807-Chlamydomonas_euryale.AAC.10